MTNLKKNSITKLSKAEAQIEQGLSSDNYMTRRAFASRTDFIPTAGQVERGLVDSDEEVRASFAERTDYTPSPAQIERGLVDDEAWVRFAFAKRADIVLTPEQIQQGLQDDDEELADHYYEQQEAMRIRFEQRKMTNNHHAVIGSPPTESETWKEAL